MGCCVSKSQNVPEIPDYNAPRRNPLAPPSHTAEQQPSSLFHTPELRVASHRITVPATTRRNPLAPPSHTPESQSSFSSSNSRTNSELQVANRPVTVGAELRPPVASDRAIAAAESRGPTPFIDFQIAENDFHSPTHSLIEEQQLQLLSFSNSDSQDSRSREISSPEIPVHTILEAKLQKLFAPRMSLKGATHHPTSATYALRGVESHLRSSDKLKLTDEEKANLIQFERIMNIILTRLKRIRNIKDSNGNIVGYNADGIILRKTMPLNRSTDEFECGAHKIVTGIGNARVQTANIQRVEEKDISSLAYKKSGLYIVKMDNNNFRYYQVTRNSRGIEENVASPNYGKTIRYVIELKKINSSTKDVEIFEYLYNKSTYDEKQNHSNIPETNLRGLFSTYNMTKLHKSIELTVFEGKESLVTNVSIDIRDFIRQNGLHTFIVQYLVNPPRVFVTRHAGECLDNTNICFNFNNISQFAQLIKHLEILHDHGVVHRDIKPANMYLWEDGIVRITDFDGLGKPEDFTTCFGTLGYCDNTLIEAFKDLPQQIKNDKFGMLISLIELTSKLQPPISIRWKDQLKLAANERREYDENVKNWQKGTICFVTTFVNQNYKEEVTRFLNFPNKHDIPKLSEVLIFTEFI